MDFLREQQLGLVSRAVQAVGGTCCSGAQVSSFGAGRAATSPRDPLLLRQLQKCFCSSNEAAAPGCVCVWMRCQLGHIPRVKVSTSFTFGYFGSFLELGED